MTIVVAATAIFMSSLSSPTSSVYFAPWTSDVFIPAALAWSCWSHVWLFGILGRRNVVRPLPLPPPSGGALDATSQPAKVAVITGSNTGIGFAAAQTLVQDYGWEVVLACRSKDKALAAQRTIQQQAAAAASTKTPGGGQAVVLDPVLDLSDFDSVRAFVVALKERYGNRRVDVLINNAGRNTSGRSTDGDVDLDLLFQSNYLGHFLLTKLMLEDGGDDDNNSPALLSRDGRVINVSSVMHHFAGATKTSEGNVATADYWKSQALYHDPPHPGVYSASKLAAVLHAVELNQRNVVRAAVVVNPGSVASDIWRGFPDWIRAIFRRIYLTPQQGSTPLVAAAVRNHDVEPESSTTKHELTYLQPYWIPPNLQKKPVLPLFEMLGPYVGYTETTPRLPDDGGIQAAKMLWQVSEELTIL